MDEIAEPAVKAVIAGERTVLIVEDDRSFLQRLAKAMESRGYIARRRLAGNRRKIHIFLTRRGRALQDKLVPLAEKVNRIAVRGVPARDVAATRRTLLAVLESLARDEARAATEPPPKAAKSRPAHRPQRPQRPRGKTRRPMA